MNRKLTIAILAGMILLPALAADVATVTKQPNGSLMLDSMDPNTAQAFYDSYVAPKVTTQIQTAVDTAVAAARVQIQQALWQQMNGAMASNTTLLQGQRADEEAALLNSLIVGAKLRLESIGRPFSGNPIP
jgi:hypothetical protein